MTLPSLLSLQHPSPPSMFHNYSLICVSLTPSQYKLIRTAAVLSYSQPHPQGLKRCPPQTRTSVIGSIHGWKRMEEAAEEAGRGASRGWERPLALSPGHHPHQARVTHGQKNSRASRGGPKLWLKAEDFMWTQCQHPPPPPDWLHLQFGG